MGQGLEKLNNKGVDAYKRNFVEIVISIAYFRVPEFRDRFLRIILEKSDDPIPDWRNTEGFDLDEEEPRDASIQRMFDWKAYCYDWIPEEDQEQAEEILEQTLDSDKWQSRI